MMFFMRRTVYIQVLGKGKTVYRAVPAVEISEDTYKVKGKRIFNSEGEEWEFTPGTIVRVEHKEIAGEKVLVAIGQEAD